MRLWTLTIPIYVSESCLKPLTTRTLWSQCSLLVFTYSESGVNVFTSFQTSVCPLARPLGPCLSARTPILSIPSTQTPDANGDSQSSPADSSANVLVFERSSKHISWRQTKTHKPTWYTNIQNNNPGISRGCSFSRPKKSCLHLLLVAIQAILQVFCIALLWFPHDQVRGTRCQIVGHRPHVNPRGLVVSGRNQMICRHRVLTTDQKQLDRYGSCSESSRIYSMTKVA